MKFSKKCHLRKKRIVLTFKVANKKPLEDCKHFKGFDVIVEAVG